MDEFEEIYYHDRDHNIAEGLCWNDQRTGEYRRDNRHPIFRYTITLSQGDTCMYTGQIDQEEKAPGILRWWVQEGTLPPSFRGSAIDVRPPFLSILQEENR